MKRPPDMRIHPDMPGEAGWLAQEITADLQKALLEFTLEFSQSHRLTGVSVVFMCIQQWMTDLVELNPQATGDYLRALADLADKYTSSERLDAENRRTKARAAILNSLAKVMDKEG